MSVIICIKHCIVGTNQCKKVRKTNKIYAGGKGRVKILCTNQCTRLCTKLFMEISLKLLTEFSKVRELTHRGPTRWMAPWLRPQTALAEDPTSVPSTHIEWLATNTSGLHVHPQAHVAMRAYVCDVYTHTHN